MCTVTKIMGREQNSPNIWKDFFAFYVYACLCVSVWICSCMGVPLEARDAPELELQKDVSCQMWVLETKCWSFAKAVNNRNHWATSPVPSLNNFIPIPYTKITQWEHGSHIMFLYHSTYFSMHQFISITLEYLLIIPSYFWIIFF